MDTSFFSSPIFWIVLIALGTTFGYRLVRSIPLVKRIPKKVFFWSGIIGVVITLGIFGSISGLFGTGSLGSSGVHIAQVQTTTAFVVDNAVADVADSGVDDTRMSDFYLNDTQTASDPVISSGIFAVTRDGTLNPTSCRVSINKPPKYVISDTTYGLLVEDSSTGVLTSYVMAAATSSAADTADPKATSMLPFAEGVSVGYVSFYITLDETGMDPLAKYDYKDVNVDMCGYPYTFRIHKLDTAS